MLVGRYGRIDAAWCAWRDGVTFRAGERAENALQRVYFTSVTNAGRTWAPDIRAIDRWLSDVWANGVHEPVGLFATKDGLRRLGRFLDGAPEAGGGAGPLGTTKLQRAALGLAAGLVLCGLALGVARSVAGGSVGAEPPAQGAAR